MLPPNIAHIGYLIVTIAAAVFGVLKVQPEFQTAAWVAAVGAVLAVLGAIFTQTPQMTAQKAAAAKRGMTTIPITEAPPAKPL
jgi:threonine/homoserine efflux transporter RhtA